MKTSAQYKLGTHRKNRRVWLDNKTLLEASGFKVGALYCSTYYPQSREITLQLHPEGDRKVAKKNETSPIIDLNSTKVGWALGDVEQVEVIYTEGYITITPLEEQERSINELSNSFKKYQNKAQL